MALTAAICSGFTIGQIGGIMSTFARNEIEFNDVGRLPPLRLLHAHRRSSGQVDHAYESPHRDSSIGANEMRSVFAAGLLITLCASASAAGARPPRTVHLQARQYVLVRPSQNVGTPRFAVPGWTDGQTQRWLDNASSSWSQA